MDCELKFKINIIKKEEFAYANSSFFMNEILKYNAKKLLTLNLNFEIMFYFLLLDYRCIYLGI